jgi:hypothetical protein
MQDSKDFYSVRATDLSAVAQTRPYGLKHGLDADG